MNKKPPKRVKTPSTVSVEDAAERAVVEASLRALASRDALAAIFQQTDEVAQMVVAAAEEEAEDDEDDVVDLDGATWRSAGSYSKTYQSIRGPIAVTRKLYRSERNGPTRCFYDERRGVIGGLFMQDLGHAVVMSVASLPAERASELLEAATGYPVSSATMKRTTHAVGNAVRGEEDEVLAAVVDEELDEAQPRGNCSPRRQRRTDEGLDDGRHP